MTAGREPWARLREQVRELCDLDAVIGLLGWDEETYAPPMARGPRGRQVATLEALAHRRLVNPALGDLIEQLAALPPQGAGDEDRAAELRLLRRRRELALRVPEPLVRALAEARSRALHAWEQARDARDHRIFSPHLEQVVNLTRERSTALSADASAPPYDALLDEHEPGMTGAVLGPLFLDLRRDLLALLDDLDIAGNGDQAEDRAFLGGAVFDEDAQWRFTLRVLRDFGFDFQRGRQDRSTHPFTLAAGEHDVRVTTRLSPTDPLPAIFSTAHEAGHALYNQGFPPRLFATLAASAPSTGMHEAQARLWENQVARSLPFWEHYYPILQAEFPAQLGGVSLSRFHRATCAVRPGPVRVGADEVTYNLHILLRHELELCLLGGDLRAADLPGAFAERLSSYLGVRPKDNLEGVLQDVHWALGSFGYFPTYALGNLYAAQLMAACERDRPGLWDDIRRGDFSPLLAWLRRHVHARGHLVSATQVLRDATSAAPTAAPFLAYLRRRYEN